MKHIEIIAYLHHSKSKSYKKKLDETINFMLKHTNYCASMSWGKDSVVMSHIGCTIINNFKIINARYPNPNERFTDMDNVRDLFFSRSDTKSSIYKEVLTPGEWEMYELVGHGFNYPKTLEERKASKWWKETFLKNMNKAVLDLGCEGTFVGLCADESRGRKINVYSRGMSYQKKSGDKIALPMSWWNPKDIWTYHVVNQLPYLKIYDESFFGREKARSGFVFATASKKTNLREMGVFEDYKKVYPKEFFEWMNRFPELDL